MASFLQNVEVKEGLNIMYPPSLDDFNLKGDQEDIEDIAAFVAQLGAQYSVLNVDFKRELLVLVKTADGVDIKNKPFLYEAQRSNAVQLLCIPFPELDKVEKVIAPKVSHVNNIFLYNTGRCGSTLLCKALEKLSTLQAVSEPDVFTTLAAAAGDKLFKAFIPPGTPKPSRELVIQAARVSTLLLNHYFVSLFPEQSTICYKFRSMVTDGAEILQKAVPAAKNIYLYRNCFAFSEGWIRVFTAEKYWLYWLLTTFRLDSVYLSRTFGNSERTKHFFGNSPEHSNVPFRHGFYWSYGYFWWSNIEKAVSLSKKDPTNFFHAILRYEDLTKRKEELVLKVAKVLGVTGSDEEKELSAISQAFKSNSQAGSGIESKRNREDTSDVWFGEWEKTQLNAVLEYIGTDVKNGDFVIPGTM